MKLSDYYLRVDKPKVVESKRNLSLSKQVFLLGTDRNLFTPSILYKYFELGNDGENDFTKRILDTIIEGALWFSTKRYLNDPCEMSYVALAANSFPPPDPRVILSIKPLSKNVAENSRNIGMSVQCGQTILEDKMEFALDSKQKTSTIAFFQLYTKITLKMNS